jgi:hypothetical protein
MPVSIEGRGRSMLRSCIAPKGCCFGELPLKNSVISTQISKGRDRDQSWSLLMLDPLILYIFAGCMVILAIGMASSDFS